MLRTDITLRPETPKDYLDIIRLILRSFSEGTPYSDGTDVLALVEEIRMSDYYIPDLSFVAELNGEIVGHFMFSKFPISPTPEGGCTVNNANDIVMLAPVAVHADHLHRHIGVTMLTQGIEIIRRRGYKGITVEGDFHFYNRLGFQTSADYDIHATSGHPLTEPRCMMCMETSPGSLKDIHGYIVYDMYHNA